MSFVALCRYPLSLCLMMPLLLGFAACGAAPADPTGDGAVADTAGDTTPALPKAPEVENDGVSAGSSVPLPPSSAK